MEEDGICERAAALAMPPGVGVYARPLHFHTGFLCLPFAFQALPAPRLQREGIKGDEKIEETTPYETHLFTEERGTRSLKIMQSGKGSGGTSHHPCVSGTNAGTSYGFVPSRGLRSENPSSSASVQVSMGDFETGLVVTEARRRPGHYAPETSPVLRDMIVEKHTSYNWSPFFLSGI